MQLKKTEVMNGNVGSEWEEEFSDSRMTGIK